MKTPINEAQALADLELLKECEQSARELYELSIAFNSQCRNKFKAVSKQSQTDNSNGKS